MFSSTDFTKCAARSCRGWHRPSALGLVFFAMLALLVFSSASWARTITVVYDDSGSMKTNSRWSYASYSLQVLRGLLRSDDKLNVFFMNQAAAGQYSGAQPQSDIEAIVRRADHSGRSTPYGAVLRAMQSIEESPEADPWLLVITDGEFDSVSSGMDDQIRAFLSRKPEVRIIFLGIAQSTNPVFDIWRDLGGARVFFAESVRDVAPVMADIGAQMTALGAGSGAAAISLEVSGNQASFVPIFPLRRLVLMQQADSRQSLTEVRSAATAGKPLKVEPAVYAAAPGNVRVAAGIHQMTPADGQAVPAGAALQFTFAGEVAAGSRFTVFPEVDAELSVVFRDGDGVPLRMDAGSAVACARGKVRIDAKVVFPAPHAAVALPRGRIEVKSRAGTTSLTHRLVQDSFQEEVSLPLGEHAVSTTASFPGYFFFQKNGRIRVVECAPRQISIVAGPAGQVSTGVAPWSAPVTRLADAPGFEVWATIDGRRATAAEFEQMSMKFDLGKLDAEVITHADRWEIKPRLRWNTPALTRVGEFAVPIQLQTKRADDVITVPAALKINVEDPGWLERFGPFIAKLLGLLMLAVYIWGIVSKDRFRPGAKVVLTYPDRRTKTIFPKEGIWRWIDRWVVPFRPERMTRSELPLLAGPNGRLRIPARFIKEDWSREGVEVPTGRDVLLRNQEQLSTGSGNSRKLWQYTAG